MKVNIQYILVLDFFSSDWYDNFEETFLSSQYILQKIGIRTLCQYALHGIGILSELNMFCKRWFARNWYQNFLLICFVRDSLQGIGIRTFC